MRERRHRAGLGRADLIRCWDRLDGECFQRVASAMGYRRQPEPKSSLRIEAPSIVGALVGTATLTATTEVSGQRYYRLVKRRALAPRPETPSPPTPEPDAEPGELPAEPLPPPPPLIPWPRLWPFLRSALGEQAERQGIDLPRVVATVARGRPLRRLPRLKGPRWAPAGQLLLDLHTRLYPFWDDFNQLKDALPRLRGSAGLEVLRLDHGPAGPVRRWSATGWDPEQPYRPPAPGTPILIAGDLGCLGSEQQRRAWLRLGRRLAGRRQLPVVLTPCPSRWWQPELAGLFFPVTLDRGTRLPPSPAGPRPWPEQGVDIDQAVAADPGAQHLLTLLSACIGITPALLRHLRHALPATAADVGGEAAAWRHPAFHAGDFALVPGEPEAIDTLRNGFRRLDADEQALAWRLIRAQQKLGASRAVCIEERVLYAAMLGRSDPEAEAFLARVEAALTDADSDRADTLGAWVRRRARRMHPAAWASSTRSEALWLRVNRPGLAAGVPLPAGFDLRRAEVALGDDEHPADWRLVQRGEHLVFDADGGAEADGFTSGSPFTVLHTRRPGVQVRELNQAGPDTGLTLHSGMSLPCNETGYRLITDSDELTIATLMRPDWAQRIGRDGDGLVVGLDDARDGRRVDWWNPGSVTWRRAGGEVIGTLELDHGFWVDEADDRAWRKEGFRAPAWADDCGVDKRGVWAAFRVDNITQRFRWVWPGIFLMGSPSDEHGRNDSEQQHKVVLSRGYWLAETACTQALWQAVMGDKPSYFKGIQHPVEQVSWDDVQGFIRHLNDKIPGLTARLPTEAEWEYACRAGTTTPFSFGEDIDPEQVNYHGNYPYRGERKGLSRGKTMEVASLPANPWGLYEMHGNVYEWCQDRFGEYPTESIVDPNGPSDGVLRVLRGGAWVFYARYVRSAYRNAEDPGFRNHIIGFRLALGPELRQAEQAGSGAVADSPRKERVGASGRRGRSDTAWSRWLRKLKP